MILCQQAHQSVNLYYGVIKFLEFKGLFWVGDSLHLPLSSLGDLWQASATVTREDGEKQTNVLWERGFLFAKFVTNMAYDIRMRLEYHGPPRVSKIETDFSGIHPKAFTTTLDFPTSNPEGTIKKVTLDIGNERHDFPLRPMEKVDMGNQFLASIHMERDIGSFSVSSQSEEPYRFAHFPTFHMPQARP